MDDAISRNVLLKDLEAWRNQLGIYTGDDPHELELWQTVGGMLLQFSDNVGRAPALDVMPVVHAHWIGVEFDGYADGYPVFDVWACSNCGEECRSEGDPPAINFCFNCAAKMDGEGDA